MTKKTMNVAFLLDESGSMSGQAEETINATNEYIKDLKKSDSPVKFTLTAFDSGREHDIFSGAVKKDLRNITGDDYRPMAATPLYDALGHLIQKLDKSIKTKNPKVLCVVLTDGQENASREFTQESVKKLIEQKTEDGWEFLYLGSNQDAWEVGGGMGINTNITYDAQDLGSTVMDVMSVATAHYSEEGSLPTADVLVRSYSSTGARARSAALNRDHLTKGKK